MSAAGENSWAWLMAVCWAVARTLTSRVCVVAHVCGSALGNLACCALAHTQERPEDVPTGDLPRSMMCLVDRRLCSAVSPGTRVTAVGILSIFQGKEGEALADSPVPCAVCQGWAGWSMTNGSCCCGHPILPIFLGREGESRSCRA